MLVKKNHRMHKLYCYSLFDKKKSNTAMKLNFKFIWAKSKKFFSTTHQRIRKRFTRKQDNVAIYEQTNRSVKSLAYDSKQVYTILRMWFIPR